MEEEVITISDEEVEVIDKKEGQVEFEPGPEGRDGPSDVTKATAEATSVPGAMGERGQSSPSPGLAKLAPQHPVSRARSSPPSPALQPSSPKRTKGPRFAPVLARTPFKLVQVMPRSVHWLLKCS